MIRYQVLKHLPGEKKGERGGSKGDVGRITTVSGSMEKSRYVRVIERKEVRGNDLIEYFLPTGIGITFRVPEEVMAVKVSQNQKIS